MSVRGSAFVEELPDINAFSRQRQLQVLDQGPSSGGFHARLDSPSSSRAPYSRPQSGSLLAELQTQLEDYKAELQRKEQLIKQISTHKPVRNGKHERPVDIDKIEALLTAGIGVENARGEIAAQNVKIEHLTSQNRNLQQSLDASTIHCKELNEQLNSFKENEARLVETISALREKIGTLELNAGTTEAAVSQKDLRCRSLEEERNTLKERVAELEHRCKAHLDENIDVGQQLDALRCNHESVLADMAKALMSSEVTHESILEKAKRLTEENELLRSKMITANENFTSTDLELKASRETISRLVSEVKREQDKIERMSGDLEQIRAERDTALEAKQTYQRELDLTNERLASNQKSYEMIAKTLKEYETKMSNLGGEVNHNKSDARNSQQQLFSLRRNLCTVLLKYHEQLGPLHGGPSIRSPRDIWISDQDLVDKVQRIIETTKERQVHADLLQDKLNKLTEQFEANYVLKVEADSRMEQSQLRCEEMAMQLRQLEHHLADDSFCGLLVEAMRLEHPTNDVGFDMISDALIARSRQLVKLEADALADKTSKVYGLQRKLKTQKQQLESKDLHLDLLRRKIAQLEEQIGGKSEVERERDDEISKVRKLAKQLERLRHQLVEAQDENKSLRARLLHSADLQLRTVEQQHEINDMADEIGRLEHVRNKHVSRIRQLHDDVHKHKRHSDSKNQVSEDTIGALRSDLRTTKQALEETKKRERQLLDLRQVIARMIGLSVDSLAVPDYEIVRRLENLIGAHKSLSGAAAALDEVVDEADNAYRAGYNDAQRVLGTPPPIPAPPPVNLAAALPPPISIDRDLDSDWTAPTVSPQLEPEFHRRQQRRQLRVDPKVY